MKNLLDLILLEDLARKYGKAEMDSFPGNHGNFNTNSYFLDIDNGRSKLEIRMKETSVGDKPKSINLELYAKKGLFDDYGRILSYIRTFEPDEKNITLLADSNYKNNKSYSKDDSTFIEVKYSKNVKAAVKAIKNFTYNKEGFEKLVQ